MSERACMELIIGYNTSAYLFWHCRTIKNITSTLHFEWILFLYKSNVNNICIATFKNQPSNQTTNQTNQQNKQTNKPDFPQNMVL